MAAVLQQNIVGDVHRHEGPCLHRISKVEILQLCDRERGRLRPGVRNESSRGICDTVSENIGQCNRIVVRNVEIMVKIERFIHL